MIENFWADVAAWWQTVAPEFALLLALPFAVAAAGVAADALRRRRLSGTASAGDAGP